MKTWGIWEYSVTSVLLIYSVVDQRFFSFKRVFFETAVHMGREGCTHVMHGRSRMTIDPRTPTMPGRSTSGFSPTKQTLPAPTAKRREVLGESHEG